MPDLRKERYGPRMRGLYADLVLQRFATAWMCRFEVKHS